MIKPAINEILWLAKEEAKDTIVLGFLRDHQEGAFIIGGNTGSYYTGHNEGWEDIWNEYIEAGYIPVDLAKQKGILDKNWIPPSISREDQELVDKIRKNLL